MQPKIKKNSQGRYILAYFIPGKKRFRSYLTKDFNPSESDSLDTIPLVRTYANADSVKRAVRKFRKKIHG
jgi:hypothetical protein